MTLRTMSDSTTAGDVDPRADRKAGYVDGQYRTAPPLIQAFGRDNVVTITVTGHTAADVVDIEAGNVGIPAGVGWAVARVKTGEAPTIYCTRGAWRAVRREVRRQATWRQRRRIHYWIAAYDGRARIPATWRRLRAVAKQYATSGIPAGQPGHTSGHQDRSVTLPYWPGVDLAPLPRLRRRQAVALARWCARQQHPVGAGRGRLVDVNRETHRVLTLPR